MARGTALRRTRHQFSDGTTIDGLRLDAVLSQLVRDFNDVPLSDIANNLVPCTYSFGWQPEPGNQTVGAGPDHKFPWMTIRNKAGATGFVGVNDTLQNEWRLKGTKAIGIRDDGDLTIPATTNNQYVWEIAFSNSGPRILHAIDLYMLKDSTDKTYAGDSYQNDFLYVTAPDHDASVPRDGEPVDDWGVTVHVDHPAAPEDRLLASVPFHRRRFNTDVYYNPSKGQLHAGGYDDMLPAFTGGQPQGPFFEAGDLMIPVPQDARLRLAIHIPLYDDATYTTGWDDGADNNSMGSVAWNLDVTFLEEIE